MLRSLHIRDFVIVEKVDIGFEDGFTVFSGETGAGKSILIDALALALGERAESSVVRVGATRADISAVFDTPEGIGPWLAEHALEGDEGELVLRRVVDAQGRGRAFVNGVPATLTQLRQLGAQLVDIHGQHAHQSLMRPDAQRELLDSHGGHESLALAVHDAWKDWREATRLLQRAEQDASGLAQERERLQWQADEHARLALQPDEWTRLSQEQHRLAHAQTLIEGAAQSMSVLDGEDSSIASQLNSVCERIAQMTRHDDALRDIHAALDSARISVGEAVSDLNHYLNSLELDPSQLANVEARLSDVFDTARKLKIEPENLLEHAASIDAQLQELAATGDIDVLRARHDQAQAVYDAAASRLSSARQKTVKPLARQVTQAMQELAMAGGKFDIALTAAPAGAHGVEQVEFLVAGHAGVPLRPLGKVASGGELSRISLALSVIASQAARVPTLIFDEVDSGVGGAVAEVVGRLLRELGKRRQVLCVTHLPQVAACATTHFQVSKRETRGTTRSAIVALDEPARVEEIARMLGGIDLTETTRNHAREMLAGKD